MTVSAAQKKATAKWQKNNTTNITIKLQNKGDKDILDYLEQRRASGYSCAGAFKEALREKIERDGKQ